MPNAIFSIDAVQDVDEAYSNYEAKLPGLGDRFETELNRVIDYIEHNPFQYGIIHQDIRAAMLRKFPYVVYYNVQPNQVVIVAIRHGHEDDKVWKGRI